MKRLTTIIALLLPAMLFAQSQADRAPVAQEQGTVLEYITKDKDGSTKVTKQEVTSVKEEDGKRIVLIKDRSIEEATAGIPPEMYDSISTIKYVITDNGWYTST